MLRPNGLLLVVLVFFCALAFVVPAEAVIINGVDYVLFACSDIKIFDSCSNATVITGNVAVNNVNGVLDIGQCNSIIGTATANAICLGIGALVTNCLFNVSCGGGNPSAICAAVAPAPLPLVGCPPLPVPVIPPCVNTAPDVTVSSAVPSTLAPGCYGDVVADVNAILTLGPGIFNFHSFRLRDGATLSGSGVTMTIVNVLTTITTGPNETISDVTLNTVASGPAPVVDIGFFNGGPTTLTNVLIYAPNDRVSLHRNVTGTGLEVVADEIRVGRGNTLAGP